MPDHIYFPFSPASWRIVLLVLLSVVPAVSVLAAPASAPKSTMHRAQKHESRHEIEEIEELWREAALTANTTAIEPLLADDYMTISPSGTLQSKEQTLAWLRSGRVHFTSIDYSDRKIRFYGSTAIDTSRTEVVATTTEGDLTGSFRYTRVYVRDAHGKWKIVSFEASRIREPGERK